MTLRWPEDVLSPRTPSFDAAPRTMSGPASISGHSQAVSSSAGIWKFTFGGIAVSDHSEILAWRALAALLEGRMGSVLVPLCRDRQPITDAARAADVWAPLPHSDDTLFSDGTGYESSSVSVEVDGAVAAGGTSASIILHYGGTPEPGHHFSVGDRLYRLKSVSWTSETEADVTFWPPAREAIADATFLEFDDPVCRMRLASDAEMDLPLDARRFAVVDVRFLEDT